MGIFDTIQEESTFSKGSGISYQYVVLQVTLKEKFIGTGSGNLTDQCSSCSIFTVSHIDNDCNTFGELDEARGVGVCRDGPLTIPSRLCRQPRRRR